eukprot:SAG11_NODE_2015_length_3921_cov_2.436944_5_plen_87_part_00
MTFVQPLQQTLELPPVQRPPPVTDAGLDFRLVLAKSLPDSERAFKPSTCDGSGVTVGNMQHELDFCVRDHATENGAFLRAQLSQQT